MVSRRVDLVPFFEFKSGNRTKTKYISFGMVWRTRCGWARSGVVGCGRARLGAAGRGRCS
jgi:hypothetical protein